MKKIKAFLYQQAKRSIPLIAKLFGANLLDKQVTLQKLKEYQVYAEDGEKINIPPAGITDGSVPESFKKFQSVATSSIGFIGL